MKSLSLRGRLLIPTILILLLGTTLLAAQVSNKVYAQQVELLQTTLFSKLGMLDQILDGDWETIRHRLIIDGAAPDHLAVVSLQGQVLFQSNPEHEVMLSSSEMQQALTRGMGFTIRPDAQGEKTAFAAISSTQTGGELVLLQLAYSITEIEALRTQINRTVWFWGGTATFLTTALILTVTNKLGTRLNTLRERMNQLEDGSFSAQISIDAQDELSRVEHALNRLNTELIQKFRHIEAEQTQLNAILEQMTDGVMILTEDGEITLVNPAAKKLFRLQDAPITGQRLPRVLAYHQIVELWQEFQDTGQEQATFLELTERNKSIHVILIPFKEVLPNHALILFQDLTKLRQLETIRRDFISNISHELRTPLASLKALAETLQISAMDDPEAAQKFLARMDTEIDALTQLVSELLELSRIESGQVPLQYTPSSPCKLLSDAYERLTVQADRAEINFILECPGNGVILLVDANRIEQTLVNLIHNAIKYTDPGGTVTCSLEITGEEAIFMIQDTGMGISAKDLPRIFERFYKVRGNHRSSGTGLGLAIAKHLVELHHGRIWAESQLGVGSTFFLALRLNP